MPNDKPRYILIGPNGEDDLSQFWSMAHEWDGDFYKARYYGEELLAYPPGELPVGTVLIMDMEEYCEISLPGREGDSL